MTDISSAPIRDVIESLRKRPKEGSIDPMRGMLAQLIFGALATRLEQQADEIERLTFIEAAAKEFSEKVEAALPHINDLCVFAHVHNQKYQGEPFGDAHETLKLTLVDDFCKWCVDPDYTCNDHQKDDG